MILDLEAWAEVCSNNKQALLKKANVKVSKELAKENTSK